MARFLSNTFTDKEMYDNILKELNQLLLSPRSTDDISSSLVETLGFDALDLITSLLTNRATISTVLNDTINENKFKVSIPDENLNDKRVSKKEMKKRANDDDLTEHYLSATPEEALRRREETRQANSKRPLASQEGFVSIHFTFLYTLTFSNFKIGL